MALTIEEVKNIIKMLSSEDSSNHEVAFEILNRLDLAESLGEILIIIKKAMLLDSTWITNCPELITKLCEIPGFSIKENSYSFCLNYPQLLEFLLENNCSPNSLKIYEELLNEHLDATFKSLGYDMNHIIIRAVVQNSNN
jgi:hypothetical protein